VGEHDYLGSEGSDVAGDQGTEAESVSTLDVDGMTPVDSGDKDSASKDPKDEPRRRARQERAFSLLARGRVGEREMERERERHGAQSFGDFVNND
ncbi:hypothetical protein KIPB_016626, partial [Kipferlia bialata]